MNEKSIKKFDEVPIKLVLSRCNAADGASSDKPSC